MTDALARVIDAAWEGRDLLSTSTTGEVRDAVDAAISLLDSGEARVATKEADGSWTVHQWLTPPCRAGDREDGPRPPLP